jgi:hypothetical protein
MARAAVIGPALRIGGYGLAGAELLPAADRAQAVRVWRSLPGDIAMVVVTSQVAGWLSAEFAARPDVLTAVLPDGLAPVSP